MTMTVRSFRPRSLRTTLIIHVILPLTVAVALTGYLVLGFWEQQVESRMQQDLEMVARAIQLPLSHAMERNRQEGVQQALDSAFAVESVYSAYAYDLEGMQIAAAGEKDPEPRRSRLTELASEGKKTGEYGRVGDRRVYSYFVPLKDSRDQSSGLLQLTRRERDFRRYLRQVRISGMIGLGVGVLVMMLFVLVGQYGAVEQHFQRITQGMQKVAAGNREHRIQPSGPAEIVSVSLSFNDMLDSIQAAEEQLKQNRREKEELENRLRQNEKLVAMGQLAAGVAHELGTPLSVISGTAQRAQRGHEENSYNAGIFRKIRHEVLRMEIIIRQLLDFSHARSVQLRQVHPGRIVNSAIMAVKEEFSDRQPEITVEGDRDNSKICVDPARLEQALINLLKNSVQATENAMIRLSWSRRNGTVVFAVDDSGPGIPAEIRPRLFEPFFTTKNVGEGTGLGLAVVHGAVKEHGGKVDVLDSDMGGARVEIHLPVRPEGFNSSDDAEMNGL